MSAPADGSVTVTVLVDAAVSVHRLALAIAAADLRLRHDPALGCLVIEPVIPAGVLDKATVIELATRRRP